ncbi:MAG: ABC transporter ATP-binding protein [Brachymonas sp.]
MNAPVMLSVKDASLRLGRVKALLDLNFSVAQGECVALVGANGSGKSSLLRLLHGLVEPTCGSAYQADPEKQGFVHQRPWMLRASVLTNVALSAWLRGMRWADARSAAALALQQVDLADLALRRARTLSGGQQQRLAVARACVAQPKVLLLDEPTSSLAPQSKRELEQLMMQLKAQGMTLVFASHNLGQVKRLATRVIALQEGRIAFDGGVAQFFDEPLPAFPERTAASLLEGEC